MLEFIKRHLKHWTEPTQKIVSCKQIEFAEKLYDELYISRNGVKFCDQDEDTRKFWINKAVKLMPAEQ